MDFGHVSRNQELQTMEMMSLAPFNHSRETNAKLIMENLRNPGLIKSVIPQTPSFRRYMLGDHMPLAEIGRGMCTLTCL